MAKMRTNRKDPIKPRVSGNLGASGEGRNINAYGSGTLEYGKNRLSVDANMGPGYKSGSVTYNRQLGKNLDVSATLGSGGSYDVNASLRIPIGGSKKKKKR